MRAGDWCPEHGNGYDDCSFLHRPAMPPSRLRYLGSEFDESEHGTDCLCPEPTCREWIETNAGRGFNDDGTPR